MWIVNFPVSCPTLFWIVAFAWSAYQAVCGYQYGLYIFDSHRKEDRHMVRVRSWFYGVHHGAFYFLCALSGFIAWNFALQMSSKIANWSEVATGSGAVLIALAVFYVGGVSGILPRILYLGNRPV
jgi:hypothetical protein